jgi:ATP-binding cassette subfamily B protein
LWIVFALTALSTAMNVLPPVVIGLALDRYVSVFAARVDFHGLTRALVLLACLYLVGSAASWGQNRIMVFVAQNFVRSLRESLFAKLQTLSLNYYDTHQKGDLMSRFTNDIDTISSCLAQVVVQFFGALLSVSGTLCMMLWLSPPLALSVLLAVPFSFAGAAVLARHARPCFTEQQKRLGDLNAMIEESVSGIRAVKIFRREEEMISRFVEVSEHLRRASTKAQIYSGLLIPLLHFCANLNYIVVVTAGGWLALRGLATAGLIQTFLLYSRTFARPLNEMATQLNTIQTAIAGAERVFWTLDEVPEITESPGAVALRRVRGDVEFRGVVFGYRQGHPILKGIDFAVKAGESLAIVGHTGAGKTTVVNLLARFYDVREGRISIDGHDIRDLTLESLRRSLGIVLQDTFLFADTVMANIAWGRPEATEAEVIRAATAAGAHDFIRLLPDGYRTLLTEEASNLSRGQRQLLAISRVLLTDPPLLVLDEATSNIDTRTEAQLQTSILKLMKGRTSFVIAHRPGTIRNADKILVMKDGEIVERGNHAELLARGGEYHDLYAGQFLSGGFACGSQ